MSASNEFHIPSLDGIRGIAALIVYVSHAGLPHLVPGGFGVTVFFFLSGYLITTLLRVEHERTGTISFGRFYLRRIYRILPPMYIVLMVVLALALSGVLDHQMSWDAVLAQFAHLTNYYYAFTDPYHFVPATSAMWSLAVEEHFYLLFPAALVLLFRKKLDLARIAALLLIVCAIVLAWRCFLVLTLGVGPDYTTHATDTRMDSILFGCILGLWCNPGLDAQRIRLSRRTAAAILGICVAMLLVSFLYRSPVFRETLRYSLQGVALFGVFFCAVRHHDWALFSWLQSRPVRALGLISYTFYLSHLPILALLNERTSLELPWRALLGFVGTTAFSALMYVLIERHLGVLRRRLHGGSRGYQVRAGVAVAQAAG